MFNLFKKKSKLEVLQLKHQKLLTEAYKLSHTNRTQSDLKMAEAEDINRKIESILKATPE
ncbi:MAG: Lacal_2735 family protein [Cyclobacteriaceae bacterium]|nr:Lacal_2735 family protein [Cyclobacteriaceae bacterium]